MKSLFPCSVSTAFVPNITHALIHNGCIAYNDNNYHNRIPSFSLQMHKKIDSIVCCQNSDITWPGKNTTRDVTGTTTTPLGIVDFLEGKNYLVTGSTGFLAKVFIEKMLRTVPQVGKIFLLIKAKDEEAAMARLKGEIIDSELFKCIEDMHGKSYKTFMLSKLVPVVGNVCESNLGMDADTANKIAKEVDVIVNSAATTTFDERYDVALNTNTKGPSRLMGFAKKCKKLSLFLHVSTAYVNGERQGIILEKPFHMGQTIAGERATSEIPQKSIPALDVNSEIKLAADLMESLYENETSQKMRELGLERARIYGWRTTYEFTKAMGEMLIDSTRGDIPVVIIRPSVIESTYREPFPGWIQGNKVLDPLILSYGKGQLPGFIADSQSPIDVVPGDMVVNAIMAAMAKHGNAMKGDLNVYHVGSSVVNPLVFHDLFKFSCDHFTLSPLMNSKGLKIGIDKMKFFRSVDKFSHYISNEIVQKSGLMDADAKHHRSLDMKCKKKAEHFINIAKIYEPYMVYKGWFDNRNTQKLMEEMSEEEMRKFGFDVGSVNWEDYISNIHIPGLRRHIMKGRLMVA